MNWINNTTCFHTIIALAVIFGLIIITCFAMFFNYNAKLNKNGVEITKIAYQTKELEKKNGKEQKEINELKQKVENLEKLNNLLVEKVLDKGRVKK